MGSDGQDMALEALEEQAESQIRRVLHDGRWFFSVIDVIGLLVGDTRPRKYWSDLKTRLAVEGSEVSEKNRTVEIDSSRWEAAPHRRR
jgi:hypothetical protein